MNNLAPISAHVPALVRAAGDRAQTRFWEFFVANIRNPHTRRAYGRAIGEFLAWCERQGVASIADVQPLHVGAYVEALTRSHSRADRQAAPCRHPHVVRLARDRPDRAGQSRRAACAARSMSSKSARRRCSILPRRARFSTSIDVTTPVRLARPRV